MKIDGKLNMTNRLGNIVITIMLPILLIIFKSILADNKMFHQTNEENLNLIIGLTNQSIIQTRLKVYVDNNLYINEDLSAGGYH